MTIVKETLRILQETLNTQNRIKSRQVVLVHEWLQRTLCKGYLQLSSSKKDASATNLFWCIFQEHVCS